MKKSEQWPYIPWNFRNVANEKSLQLKNKYLIKKSKSSTLAKKFSKDDPNLTGIKERKSVSQVIPQFTEKKDNPVKKENKTEPKWSVQSASVKTESFKQKKGKAKIRSAYVFTWVFWLFHSLVPAVVEKCY